MTKPAGESVEASGLPLAGVRILVTRPQLAASMAAPHVADPLTDALLALGAEVLCQPAIRLAPPDDWQTVDNALSRLPQYDWLVFSSANGVRVLLDRLQKTMGDWRAKLPKLAAMGPGTAEELASHGLRPEIIPKEFRAEALAEALAPVAAGKHFLLARASRGREVLAEQLSAAGGRVEQVVVYVSTDVDRADSMVHARLSEGSIDWVTVTSSMIARSLVRLFGSALQRARLASISPVTSKVLQELGYPPTAEARQYTLPGLVAAIVDYRP